MSEGCCPSRAGLQELFTLWRGTQRREERRRDLSGRREVEMLDTWSRAGRPAGHPGAAPETDPPSGSSLLDWAAKEELRAFRYWTPALREPFGVGTSEPRRVNALITPGLAEQVPEGFALAGETSFRDRVPQVALTGTGQLRWYGTHPVEPWSALARRFGMAGPRGSSSGANERAVEGVDTTPVEEADDLGDETLGTQCLSPIEPPPWGTVRESAKGDYGLEQTYPIQHCVIQWWPDLPDSEWPPTDGCVAPCLRTPPVCRLPDDTLVPKYNVRALTDAEIELVNAVNGEVVRSGLTERPQDCLAYVRAAVRFLVDHHDLALWAVCVANAFNPVMSQEERDAVVSYLGQRLTWGFNVYVIGQFDPEDGGDGATAAATDIFEHPNNCAYDDRGCSLSWGSFQGTCTTAAVPSEGYGVVVAANHPYVLRRALMYGAARSTGQVGTTQNAVRYVIWMAGVILHEMLHMYNQYPVVAHCMPGFAPDGVPGGTSRPFYVAWDAAIDPSTYHCWRNQAQATNNFVYAATLRFGAVCSFPDQALHDAWSGFEWPG